jgi:hypothetical protein
LIKELKKDSAPSQYRLWYNDWVKKNARGLVLDVGKSKFWDYGFITLDINPKLNPTYVGDIQDTKFLDEAFDVVLCNGMYECVKNPQAMIYEVLRITKKTAIFGFVGKGYKPYKKDWNYYDGYEELPEHTRKNFGDEYYFIICEK